jgi:hypothetical protein
MANAPDGPVEKKKLYSDGTAFRFATPASGDFPADDLNTALTARALNEAALPTSQPVGHAIANRLGNAVTFPGLLGLAPIVVTRRLFHFASGRTHAGGLLGLGVNADQRHSTHAAAARGNHVATSPQVGLDLFGQGIGHRQAAQPGAALAEGADEMRGGEARRLKRLLGTHVEFHEVEDDLDGCLILLVATSY